MAETQTNIRLVAFHLAQFDDCFFWWSDEGERENAGLSANYVAYHVISHAAYLSRCKEDASIRKIEAMPTEQLTVLLVAASMFAEGFELPEAAKTLLGKDALEADELEYFEHLLSHRDELDLVIEQLKKLSLKANDESLRKQVGRSICVAASIDDVLLVRPDIMSVCSRALAEIRPKNWLSSGSYPDWFAILRSWDEEFESKSWWGKATLENAFETKQHEIADDSLHPTPTIYTPRTQASILLENRIQEDLSHYSLAESDSEEEFSDKWKISYPFSKTNEARFASQRKSVTENSLSTAASAGEIASAFLHIIYKIDGDSLVEISLNERPNEDGNLELVVDLLGETCEAQRYASVEIEFYFESTAWTLSAKFSLEDAIIQIGDQEAKAVIRSIILTDMSNNQRRVIEG